MKQLVALLICICIVLSLAACGKQKVEWTGADETKTDNADKGPDDQIVVEKPLICVSMPVKSESFSADDGTEIFRHIYQDMALYVADPEVAEKVTLDFLNRSDGASAAESIYESAKSNYQSGAQWTPYLCQVTYDPMRMDAGVLSLFGSYATYSGTPHPESSYLSVSYDLLTGDVLSMDHILSDSASTETIAQLVIDSLNSQKNEKNLFVGFEDTVNERFSKNVSAEKDWYFSDTGLCFFFSPYEIASYASGVVVAEISYEKLAGIINDAYIPAEQDTVSGTITVTPFADYDASSEVLSAEVSLTENGSKLMLTTTTAVQLFRIETGTLSTDGTNFTPEYTVFATADLTVGNAVILEAAQGKVVRLTYRSGQEIAQQIITVS